MHYHAKHTAYNGNSVCTPITFTMCNMLVTWPWPAFMKIMDILFWHNSKWHSFSTMAERLARDSLPVPIHLLLSLILCCQIFLLLLAKCIFLLCHPYLTQQNFQLWTQQVIQYLLIVPSLEKAGHAHCLDWQAQLQDKTLRTKLTALETISRWPLLKKRIFEPPFRALRGNVCTPSIGRSRHFRRGWVTLSADFTGKGASPTNHCWCQSSRVIAVSCGIKISAVHHLALSQSMRVTDR